jgi:hypothetical protein
MFWRDKPNGAINRLGELTFRLAGLNCHIDSNDIEDGFLTACRRRGQCGEEARLAAEWSNFKGCCARYQDTCARLY